MKEGPQNIKLVARLRPLNNLEMQQGGECCIKYTDKQISVIMEKLQLMVIYEEVNIPKLQSVMNGYNGTIFAYGQKSSGKTHSMERFNSKSNGFLIQHDIQSEEGICHKVYFIKLINRLRKIDREDYLQNERVIHIGGLYWAIDENKMMKIKLVRDHLELIQYFKIHIQVNQVNFILLILLIVKRYLKPMQYDNIQKKIRIEINNQFVQEWLLICGIFQVVIMIKKQFQLQDSDKELDILKIDLQQMQRKVKELQILLELAEKKIIQYENMLQKNQWPQNKMCQLKTHKKRQNSQKLNWLLDKYKVQTNEEYQFRIKNINRMKNNQYNRYKRYIN